MPQDIEAGGSPTTEVSATRTAPPAKEGEQSTEQTDQQKIDALVNRVREVNAQLGGKVAAEVKFASGRSTIFFARTNPDGDTSPSPDSNSRPSVYGVDSMKGPIYVSGNLSLELLGGEHLTNNIDLERASRVAEDEVRDWVHPVGLDKLTYWGKVFDASKAAVLLDQREMQRIREARSRNLDQALAVVSKLVDINGPPSSGTATASLAAPPPTAFK